MDFPLGANATLSSEAAALLVACATEFKAFLAPENTMRQPILIELTAKQWKAVEAAGVGLLLLGLLSRPRFVRIAGT